MNSNGDPKNFIPRRNYNKKVISGIRSHIINTTSKIDEESEELLLKKGKRKIEKGK